MKNYRFLVPIVLVVIFVCSIFVLYDGKATIQETYNSYLSEARKCREQGIYVDAKEYYEAALDVQPSLELYLELGALHDEHGRARLSLKLAESLLAIYPEEPQAYEYALRLYMDKKDYIACFDLAETMRKRGVKSEAVETTVTELEYQYYFVSEYDNVGYFGGGMCPVQVGDRWGFVDTRGVQYVSARFAQVGPFSGGLAPVVDSEGSAYFIDNAGNKKRVVLNVEGIVELGLIENDVFRLYNGQTWGFYNLDGTMLFGGYEDVSNIGNGVAAVKSGGSWQLVGYKGNDLTGETYAAVHMDEKGIVCRNERIFVSDGNGYRMIDTSGNVCGKDVYEEVRLFNDATYAAVKVNGSWGFVDKDGEMRIEPQYEDARSFSNGLAAVKVGGMWGFIDLEGTLVLDAVFLDARDFTNSGSVYVHTGKEWEMLMLYKYNH